ncbi:MAG: tRNA glutamyl-Q(34) synthetase GluQRS [Rhodospirillales bacterium]|nr:tRNA glutamyl-Q(34) synthetase GluQRS [Rhodospirillales bacterium]
MPCAPGSLVPDDAARGFRDGRPGRPVWPAVAEVTRFAPSPTGDLHLGHAYAAWFARTLARRSGGRFFVRIEDIDGGRCRNEFVVRNLDDLHWLGLDADEPVLHQSARMPLYAAALGELGRLGVVYPCFCTRRAILAEVAAAGGAPHGAHAAGTVAYPGTCRRLDAEQRARLIAAGTGYALRLDATRALRLTGPLDWSDRRFGLRQVTDADLGDPVIARKEMPVSYHLCVVVDDAAQGVTLVTRGEDLLCATAVHRTLQALLGLPVPQWWHHPLCRDAGGRRLAKRDAAASIRELRQRGLSPAEVLRLAQPSEASGLPLAAAAEGFR